MSLPQTWDPRPTCCSSHVIEGGQGDTPHDQHSQVREWQCQPLAWISPALGPPGPALSALTQPSSQDWVHLWAVPRQHEW